MIPPITAVLLDVDGTLVDSNAAHASAWVDCFTEAGIAVDATVVRRAIGMGGDKLLPAVSGIDADSIVGRRLSARRRTIFAERYLPDIRPLRDAAALVAALRRRGLTPVVASSAQRDELRSLLEIAGAPSLIDSAASSDDAAESKPEPDIVEAALEHAHATPAEAIMVGDTPYDVQAARRAGVGAIAFRSGGWADADLTGALAIYDGPWDLLAHLVGSPILRRPTGAC